MRNKRLNVTVKPDEQERIRILADKMGIAQAAVMRIALSSGLKSLEMVQDPKWQAYFEEKIVKGEPMDIPDLEK